MTGLTSMWWVYLVRTKSGRLYCGVTTNLDRRVYEHNFTRRGAKATRGDRPVELVWDMGPMPQRDAKRREWQIKRLNRFDKLRLVDFDGTV